MSDKNDTISRSSLLESIDGIYDCCDMVFEGERDHSCRPEDCGGCHWHDTKQYIRKLVARHPAVKRSWPFFARWYRDKNGDTRCSRCHKPAIGDYVTKYCPHCGAKMKNFKSLVYKP